MAAPMLQHFERPIQVSVKGIVVDGVGDVVQGAQVNLLVGEQAVAKAEGSEDGAFTMNAVQLKAGIHKLRASKPGYSTSEETITVTESMSDSTQFMILRLNLSGWEDPSKDPSQFISSAVRDGERRSLKQKYAVVDVFFATDRKYQNVRNVYQRFGSERSADEKLSLGICRVSIPQGHRLGQLESPIFKLKIIEDPERHVVVLELTMEPDDSFVRALSRAVATSAANDAFVFIHGYNVTFRESVRRTAQMAFDLNFTGAPICYSWPSCGEFSKYPADEAAVGWTSQHLYDFLLKVARDGGASTIHLIAHSMGNRALVRSLERISLERPSIGKCRIRQVVLAAPDVDRGEFSQIAGAVASCGERTTMYASSNDLALAASQQFHAYPRAGEGGDNILVLPAVDTVDASLIPSGFLGHSYYGGRTALTDIYELVRHGTPPPRFGLKSAAKDGLTYWLIQA
jgi:esterase/lipase superfamily enzyme